MQVSVNGKTFTVPDGSSVNIVNNVVMINGQPYEGPGYDEKHFKIEITGGLASVKVERGDVTVHGDVKGNVDAGGSITVNGNVAGSADAGGTINCGDVGGDADAGGSIKCGKIGGDADAGGSIRHG